MTKRIVLVLVFASVMGVAGMSIMIDELGILASLGLTLWLSGFGVFTATLQYIIGNIKG